MFQTLEEAILQILEKQEQIQNYLEAILQVRWSTKDVANYLNKSTKTIENYIKKGELKEGVHFVKTNTKRLEFFPKAIIQFQKERLKHREIKKVEKQLHPISKKILQKIN